MKRFIHTTFFTLSLLVLLSPSLRAQHDANWKSVDSLYQRQYFRQAYEQADSLYSAALRRHDGHQALVGAGWLAKIGSQFQENSFDSAFVRYRRLQPQLQGVDAAVCRLLTASIYVSYYSSNSWSIMRNAPSDDAAIDYPLWSSDRMRDTVSILIRSALSDTTLLMRTPSTSLGSLATVVDGNDGDLTPTVFDVMARKALSLITEMGYDKLLPADVGNTALLWADASRFTSLPLGHVTSARAVSQFALTTLQQLERLHLKRGESNALMIEHYLYRTSQIPQLLIEPSDQMMENKAVQLQQVIAHYRPNADDHITLLYSELAAVLHHFGRYREAVAAIDTARALFPDSPGGISCYNLRSTITKKDIRMDMIGTAPSAQSQLAIVHSANVDHLYFRVIKYVDYGGARTPEACRRKLLAQKVVEKWDQPLVVKGDYKAQSTYTVIPPLPQGDYLLLASCVPTFDTEGIATLHFTVEDIAFVADRGSGSIQRGFVIDRTSGQPVPNLDVTLQGKKNYNSPLHDIVTVRTDKDGYFDFSPYIKTHWQTMQRMVGMTVAATYKGYKITHDEYGMLDKDTLVEAPMQQNSCFFLDRPIYKPGDTVHFAHLTYRTNRTSGATLSAQKMQFILTDINNKAIDTITATTDAYGLCQGTFVLPADALPGQWYIRTRPYDGGTAYLTVEAYKQPKFAVTLSAPAIVAGFGQTARFEGVAASYSAVPISGATVTYTVTRQEMAPYWRCGWGRWWHPTVATTVASGEVTTADDGTFAVDFIPLPDSSVDFSHRPSFNYRLTVDVTDINGETHAASTSLNVGFINSYAAIELESDDRDDMTFNVVCRNLDGQPVSGNATITLERLTVPDQPKMRYGTMSYDDTTITMSLSRSEFERLFPHFDYDGSASDIERWRTEKPLFTTQARITADSPYHYSLKGRASGAYRVRATMRADNGDTLTTETFLCYEPNTASQPVRADLLTVEADKTTCEVGDSVTLRIGSRHNDVTVYLLINKSGVTYRHQLRNVSRGYTTVVIPVTEQMLGGFKIEAAAILANQMSHTQISVNVPYTHKRLDVSFETFRDKLQPGNNERWTLRVKDHKSGQPLEANLLMTMYDHALDTYRSLSWHLNPWPASYTSPAFSNIASMTSGYYNFHPHLELRPNKSYRYRIAELQSNFFAYRYARNLRMYKSAALATARGVSGVDEMVEEAVAGVDEMVEEAVEEELFMLDDAKEMAPMTAKFANSMGLVATADEVVAMEEEVSLDGGGSGDIQIRQNLNTLAFFRPALRSTADGLVELSFTVPDLLTEWNIKGLAWTPDLKTGSLSSHCITQKRLMVVPNVPRLLRHGDTCRLSVKVSNLSDTIQHVAVALSFLDPNDGALFQFMPADTLRNIILAAGASGEVDFLVVIPHAPVFLANYRVTARGQGCSDGEQGPIPILPNLQLVTESKAFYMNTAGEKTVQIDHLTQLRNANPDTMTLRHYGLTLDLTPNALWMALQALPYVAQQQNPSNIYLANAIYTNSLSLHIIDNNPDIEQLLRTWSESHSDALQSELDRNADLKQTVMEETPWLRDALGEEQRHRDIARFFNRTTLDRKLQKDLDRLLDAQRSDGGWCWIEGGRFSSLYTTQYIVKSFGHLRQQGITLDSRTRRAINRALDYIDRETYDFYRRHLKDHHCEAVNLDYLYLRSLFTDHKPSRQHQEAYDFFYSNAKKYNKEYRDLYSQALLSLVFHRAGDRQLAIEMATRIQQKALTNDEMGTYWRDNISGFCWHERPIETQALLIRTFSELLGARADIAPMQQWLLAQKRTTNWNTDVATVSAIQALLIDPTGTKSPRSDSRITLVRSPFETTEEPDASTIHTTIRLDGPDIKPDDGIVTLRKEGSGTSWGALYWQYFERVDKIQSSNCGIALKRTAYKVQADGSLARLQPTDMLRVGDKVRVRLEMTCDRTLEYVELREPRPAAFEPLSTASGWHWNAGLSFYRSITNTAQTLYIDRLDKGNYIIESDFYVTLAGTYLTAPTVAQCLYAPEFRATLPMPAIKVVR